MTINQCKKIHFRYFWENLMLHNENLHKKETDSNHKCISKRRISNCNCNPMKKLTS